ncbi:MAG: hypothetical protein IAE94_01475 [Chthoniobacterales bacterium]|nr:hypothetical protein [Chthoniobacterales bacterium]
MNPLSSQKRGCVLAFLVIGVLIRVWNIGDPIIDAMSSRQGQTADAIRSLIEEPGFQLDSNASWRGTEPARILQELPVYGYLTQGVYEILTLGGVAVHPSKPGVGHPHLEQVGVRAIAVLPKIRNASYILRT